MDATVAEALNHDRVVDQNSSATANMVASQKPDKLETTLIKLIKSNKISALQLAGSIVDHMSGPKYVGALSSVYGFLIQSKSPFSSVSEDHKVLASQYQNLCRSLLNKFPGTHVKPGIAWRHFVQEPNQYHAALVSSHGRCSVSDPMQFLTGLQSLIKDGNKLQFHEQTLLRNQFGNNLRMQLTANIGALTENQIGNGAQLLVNAFKASFSSQSVRDAWGIWAGSESESDAMLAKMENEMEDSQIGEPGYVEPTKRPLTNGNETLTEFLIMSLFGALSRHDVSLANVASRVAKDSFTIIVQRIKEAHTACGRGLMCISINGETCRCLFDPLTAASKQFVNHFAEANPRLFMGHIEHLVELSCAHLTDTDPLISLLRVQPDSVASHLDQLFAFNLNQNPYNDVTRYKLLQAVAVHCPTKLGQKHADFLDTAIRSDALARSNIIHCLKTVELVAQNRTDLMLGKGENYYDVVIRAGGTKDLEDAWKSVDIALRCIGLNNASEAHRVVNIMIGGSQLISPVTHREHVLDQLIGIGLAHKSAVVPYRNWVEKQAADPYLRTIAFKLLIVLNENLDRLVDGGGSLGTASCTIM